VAYEFRLPGLMHFGWGAVQQVGAEATKLGRLALLVTGRSSMRRTGVLGQIQGLLSAAGVATILFDEIESDPSSSTVDRGAELARRAGCDLVIGLGGGSAMDAGRAIAAMAVLDGSMLDYLGGKPVDRPGLPLVNIATTSGTASEITPIAVILHEGRRLKMGLKSPFWFSRVAITDPELTLTMPPALTAATGLDALTHAIESYISTGATPPSEALALRSIELVGAHLREAFGDGHSRPAREGMALASMIAGMAFANSGLGLVHGLVHPIGARFGVSHGALCGRLLPHVIRYNEPAAAEKLTRVGRALTGNPEATSSDAGDAVEALLRDLQVPSGIADIPIPTERLPELAKDGLVAGAVRTNPRPVTEQDALQVLQAAASQTTESHLVQ